MIKGIGLDVVELERIARVVENYGDRFLKKIFTEDEREYFERWQNPVPGIAGRFAAKEACFKALSTGWSEGVRWRDVEVLRKEGGQPYVRLHGSAAAVLAKLGARSIHCSITHSKDHAAAVVVLE